MPRPNSSTSSSRRRASLLQALFGAACYVGLVAGWQSVVVPLLPPKVYDDNELEGTLIWAEPLGVFETQGLVDQARTLVVGDSRARYDILLPDFASSGFEESAILWGPASKLNTLLDAARRYPARRLVVCLSTLSLCNTIRTTLAQFEQGEGPPELFEGSDEALNEWRQRRITGLVADGRRSERAAEVVDGWLDFYGHNLPRSGWSRASLDSDLNQKLDWVRLSLVRAISTSTWRTSWDHLLDETSSEESYERNLEKRDLEEYQESCREIASQLARLREDGWKVVCVRLPVSDGLHELELRYVSDQSFEELCREAGVPYLDYSKYEGVTRDGSHLIQAEAVEFTRLLANDLKQLDGQ